MIYRVLTIDEDIDFGCEERADDAPVMALVTLLDEEDNAKRIRQADAMLYERNINEGDLVRFDADGKLVKIQRDEKESPVLQ